MFVYQMEIYYHLLSECIDIFLMCANNFKIYLNKNGESFDKKKM